MGQGALSKPVVQWWLSLNSSKSGLEARTRGRNRACACEVPKKTRDQVTKVWSDRSACSHTCFLLTWW